MKHILKYSNNYNKFGRHDINHLFRNVIKLTFRLVRPVKILISLPACAFAQSDQNLIRIFIGRILDLQGCEVSSCEQPSRTTITKTRLYNFDPLKPHFYILKLGFTGVYIIFIILLKNIDCGYSLEPPRRGGSNEYPQSMLWAEIRKISEFFIRKFSFFDGKIFSIFE